MDELIDLSNETLGNLPEGVRVPSYDRSKLTPGIVHIGLGNFHRAHQAWYLHRLMDEGLSHDWAIIGASVRDADNAQRDKLLSQDCLTTLVELDPAGTATEVVGSIIDYLPIEQDNASLIATMADPKIRIVSMTVTESGYYRKGTDGVDLDHPDVRHDIENPASPRTVFGAMIEALRRRRAAGHQSFTAQCCDNLRGNGDVLRRTVVSIAKMSDPDLAAWIDENTSFPNSMVDCIVPGTGPAEIEIVQKIGINDKVPVTHENFRQWVLEDDFCAGRPSWEKVGATFSEHVHAYEEMKIRILNGGHQLCGEPGEVMSIKTISGSILHPAIQAYWRKTQKNEIAQQVADVPEITSQDYVDLIQRRFSNTRIVDQTRRICFDGSTKHPGFLHPTLTERLDANEPIDGLALCEAIWARMCEGTREDGSVIAPNDPQWDSLQAAATAAKDRPEAWLEQTHIYGDLADNSVFRAAFSNWLTMIWQDGCEAALKAYVAR